MAAVSVRQPRRQQLQVSKHSATPKTDFSGKPLTAKIEFLAPPQPGIRFPPVAHMKWGCKPLQDAVRPHGDLFECILKAHPNTALISCMVHAVDINLVDDKVRKRRPRLCVGLNYLVRCISVADTGRYQSKAERRQGQASTGE